MKRLITAIISCCALLTLSCDQLEKYIGVTSITISQEAAEMYVGETVQLSATVKSTVKETVLWGSTRQSVATVSETGLVTALAEGTSTVTASAG